VIYWISNADLEGICALIPRSVFRLNCASFIYLKYVELGVDFSATFNAENSCYGAGAFLGLGRLR